MNEVLKCDKFENKVLWAYVGLPYSGKTTRAKGSSWPIVCPDTIRIALHGHKFIAEAEPYVWAIAKTMVISLFLSGHDNVILDATNTTIERRRNWISSKWETIFQVVDTPKEECLRRAALAGDDAIIPIIEKMAIEFQPLTPEERHDKAN